MKFIPIHLVDQRIYSGSFGWTKEFWGFPTILIIQYFFVLKSISVSAVYD